MNENLTPEMNPSDRGILNNYIIPFDHFTLVNFDYQ